MGILLSLMVFILFTDGFLLLGRLVWREQDWPEIWTALASDAGACRQLAALGLLKFAKNEFHQSQDRLLRYIIQHWCRKRNMFVLRRMNLIIHPETNIYFLIRLLPQGKPLRYPLPVGRVNMDRFWRRHYGGAPLTKGCINIASVIDVAERCALAIIV